MRELFIDNKAIEFIKKALANENAEGARLFISGGGCCKQFELIPVKKALKGDATCERDGIKLYIEKVIFDNTEKINIKYHERNGLLIDLE
ncbi:MAG: hypothetical protein J5U17_08140 [Candidatus Methanoperedens sp.]|nr:hypothetical protein [Candidatus Methanoperedens sp.]MCE8425730.1 hypothetical protein [Candidatus Methanoperedens sp.]MCE8427307.1 hypothetical protein [Candidatus Methanoperedens sp.]